MKKIVLIFASLTLVLPMKSQSVRGNGNVVEQERNISDFRAISVKDGIDLFLDQSETVKIVVKADENLQDLIVTEVNSGELKIYINGNIREAKKLEVYLSIQEIESLTASDGSDVETLSVLKLENLNVECTDGSDLKLKLNAKQLSCTLEDGSDAKISGTVPKININASEGSDIDAEFIAEEVTCKIDEGSDLRLSGETNYIYIEASQGSDVDAYDFKAANFSLKLYEGSDANIFVTNNLDVIAKGGSDVNVKGNPSNKNVNVSDDSDISFR